MVEIVLTIPTILSSAWWKKNIRPGVLLKSTRKRIACDGKCITNTSKSKSSCQEDCIRFSIPKDEIVLVIKSEMIGFFSTFLGRDEEALMLVVLYGQQIYCLKFYSTAIDFQGDLSGYIGFDPIT